MAYLIFAEAKVGRLRKPQRLTFLHRNQVRPTGFEFVSTGIEFGCTGFEFVFPGIELDAQGLSLFPQELLPICHLAANLPHTQILIPAQKSEPPWLP